jgi:16S rRNA (cytosine967-C5)-methyltransferase
VSRFHSYISSSAQIIAGYNGSEPFSSFIKKYFSANKKFGSKDRKTITHLCYCWFRLGHALKETEVQERMLIALFLCSQTSNEVLLFFKPAWNDAIELTVAEKLRMLNLPVKANDIFPFANELSKEISADDFSFSHFIQPNLFLRMRPGQQQKVMSKLQTAQLSFQLLNNDCIALPNATKIEQIIELNKEAVVQDYSSQRVGELLQIVKSQTATAKLNVWDCCAASGGKSIMLYDLLPHVELTVSDIRDSILVNLQNRFADAGIKKFKSLVMDLSAEQLRNSANNFHLIIADVPCSGSGTWSRTPEHLAFFRKEEIVKYASLQKKIITNCIPSLKPNGYLLYITCSVFKKENEEVVSFLQEQHQLKLIEQRTMKGYDIKADTMFAALLKKI